MKLNLVPRVYKPDFHDYGIQANDFVEKIINEFQNIDYDNYFKKGKVKPLEQKIIVNEFQTDLLAKLNLNLVEKLWSKETFASETTKDRLDFYYEIKLDGLDYKVIIELDKSRSDQIAKKFVSRTCHTLDRPTIYFAFCYPGTKHMSYEECEKYIKYCEAITDNLSSKSAPRLFVGLLMEKKPKTKRRRSGKKAKV